VKYLGGHMVPLGFDRRNTKVEQTAKHCPPHRGSELRYKEDDERLNLNSGEDLEDLKESARF
jgi:hypothetical protein